MKKILILVIMLVLLSPISVFAAEISGELYTGYGIDIENVKIGVQLNIQHSLPFGIFADLYGGWEVGVYFPEIRVIEKNVNYDLYTVGYKIYITDAIYMYIDHFCKHPENHKDWNYSFGTYAGVKWSFGK